MGGCDDRIGTVCTAQFFISSKGMKRKISQESETSKKTKRSENDGLVWELVIRKLTYVPQMKLSQVNQRLADIVDQNAERKLQKFRRLLLEDKYM